MLSRRRFLTRASSGLGLALGSTGWPLTEWWDGGTRLQRVQRESLLMGSVATFHVVAPTEQEGYAAINRAVEIFRDLDRKLSMYRPDSEIAGMEATAGDAPISISTETETVLQHAQTMARRTNGRFDVTIEPLMRRWGFRDDPQLSVERPTEEELRRLDALVDHRKLTVEGGRARLRNEGMALDLGGIAGGYALDRAITRMRSMNVAAALINFSGDIHCFGTPAKGQPWTVHLVDPVTLEPREETVTLRDEALSTSGSYQNRRHTPRGESWGHLLHPRLAMPVEPVGSVTAIHPSALKADAWSTALYLGAEANDPSLRVHRLAAE